MHIIQAILALTFISLALGRCDSCFEAYVECDWEFDGHPGKIPSFPVRSIQDKPFTPRIVSKDGSEVLGILNTNNIIPEFIEVTEATPITNFRNPSFTPTHFKPFSLPRVMGSGVGHQTFHGNQQPVDKGKCVRVYITNYQSLFYENDLQVDNINVGREDNKCVVFRLYS